MLKKEKSNLKWEHDPNAYEGALSGYTGVDPHTIMQFSIKPAVRIQIGWRGLYKGGLAQLPNGDLIALAAELPGHVYPKFPIHLFKSTDSGYTWDKIDYTPALYGKEPGLTCLRDGTLFLTLESWGGVTACSKDGGRSWHVTEMIRLFEDVIKVAPNEHAFSIVRNPIEHDDGSISLLLSKGYWEWAPEDSPICRAWLIKSYDGGITWTEREEIKPTWNDYFCRFAEAYYLRLPDNRLLATTRFEFLHPIKGTQTPWPPKTASNDHACGHMVLMESSDEGRTWSEPRDFLNYSEVHGQFTLLKDGRLLCTYANYHLPFGIAAVVSYDMGKTWDMEHCIQLAVSNGINTGWPTTRQLDDGSLITLYAMEPYHLEPVEKGRYVCQCVKWEL